ncbi:flagellar basal body rod protein FlgG [Paenibacillus sp. GCM10027628]|uniref:flagellar basal body rod protein FlgG n=1 Tax=Paenibacillus sp. GCM10027628 TaxID=3273413 RepID=UPI003626D738
MLRSLYSGVSGMRGFQTKLDVIGNNIANVNTIGFKGSRVMFKDILSQTVSGVSAPDAERGGVNAQQVGLGVSMAAIDTIHTQGSAMTTNVTTDLRINGDGFFAVDTTTPSGPFLTRSGNFTLDANRNLVNADGLHVLDASGAPVVIDPAIVSFSIGQDGTINGIDNAGAKVTGQQLGIITVDNPGGLEKVGGNLYRTTANAPMSAGSGNAITTPGNAAAGAGTLVSGQLEMSNVDLTGEFTEMIIAQRGFQANSRIITTSDEVLQEVVNLKH